MCVWINRERLESINHYLRREKFFQAVAGAAATDPKK